MSYFNLNLDAPLKCYLIAVIVITSRMLHPIALASVPRKPCCHCGMVVGGWNQDFLIPNATFIVPYHTSASNSSFIHHFTQIVLA